MGPADGTEGPRRIPADRGRGVYGAPGTLLVVDGAVDLPEALARGSGCRQVAGAIWLEDARFTGTTEELWAMLRNGRPLRTTPPTVSELARAFGVGVPTIGVHVSAQLSITVARAREAATRVGAETGSVVHVVDTGSLSVGAGLVALGASHAARQPEPAAATWARSVASRLHTFALVQEMRALRRSDRSSLVPRAHLASKNPLVLAIRGRVVPLAQPRDRRHALREIEDCVRTTAGSELGAWAIGHGDAFDLDAMVEHFSDRFGMPPRFTAPLDPAVGAHLGPDAVVVGVLTGRLEP